MKQLERCFKSLELAAFLRASPQSSNHILPDIELLTHGKAFAAQLKHRWLSLRNLAVNFDSSSVSTAHSGRLSFTQSKQLQLHLQQLNEGYPHKFKCPTLFKHQQHVANGSSFTSTLYTHKSPVTHLITDFLVEPHRGLEHFYNIQRESKIWWMRYSSNPSRYAIVPCNLQEERQYTKDCQAVDIKASFDAHELTVEQITLGQLPEGPIYKLPDARTGKTLTPAIIRSTIELESATCSLLLDGCDHGRGAQSLLLNRVLAPYQCAIACVQNGNKQMETNLSDLGNHFVHELQRAGLRVCTSKEKRIYTVSNSKVELEQNHQSTDMLGVPYALILDDRTLENGLLQLRNRDTKLSETIHISDIPDYLLNIFRN